MPKIYIASDHAGFVLKEALIASLKDTGYEVKDCGAYVLDDRDDYPDFVRPCVQRVAEDTESFGIVIGASGQGEAMVANRIPFVRACVYYGQALLSQTDIQGQKLSVIESARVHNNANVLSLGARFVSEAEALSAVQQFLQTPFPGDARHTQRITKIESS